MKAIHGVTIAALPGILRGIGLRQLRIACGLILFSYLLSHFANHALGNVSFAVMSDWLDVHMAFWRHPVVACWVSSSWPAAGARSPSDAAA